MNTLAVGADKTPVLESVDFSSDFLLIDDGPLIDALEIPKRRKVTRFDVKKHHLNPLHEMDYRRAREFVAVLDAVFPEGENTLTKKNANFALLGCLLNKPKELSHILGKGMPLPLKVKPEAFMEAQQKIDTILFSPVLSTVLCKATNFSLKGIVLARLDRAVLGDFDAFVLGSLLISQFQGQVIVPDGGFYLREHHVALIRQERLIAGVNTLSDVSEKLRQALLTMPEKAVSGTTYEDAMVLASYLEEQPPGTEGHSAFIKRAMQG